MKNNLQYKFIKIIDKNLNSLGFKLANENNSFIRTNDDLSEKFQLVILNDGPGYRICPSASVRFEKVEGIFHRTSGYESEYQKGTPTLGLDFWRLYGKDGYQIPLNTEDDLDICASHILTIFNEKAKKYFSDFDSLISVDRVVNDRPYEKCIHRIMPWLRCSTGAIVARLTGREKYDQLISIYQEALRKDANGYYLPRFESLLSDLVNQDKYLYHPR